MAPLSRRAVALLALLLAAFATADVFTPRDGFVLRTREDDPPADYSSPYCFPTCDLDACGVVPLETCRAGNLPSSTSPQRRSLDYFGDGEGIAVPSNFSYGGAAVSSGGSDLHVLAKRAFTRTQWTKEDIQEYLPKQIKGEEGYEQYFGGNAGFTHTETVVDENGKETRQQDVRTVSQQKAFRGTPFQYGTGSPHGCTMLTVVSQRAVWTAHFWEVYTTGVGTDDLPKYDVLWKERVLDAIQGQMVVNPTNVKPSSGEPNGMKPWYNNRKPTIPDYITPDGQGLDPRLFNRASDQPIAYIMTPLKWIHRDEARANGRRTTMLNIRYPRKINQLRSMLEELLPGLKSRIQVFGYAALDYSRADEAAQVDTNERGMTLFQYDPKSDGKSQKAFRLFYQQMLWSGKVSGA
ncbi:hypothetical protein LTR85_006737 [Meristemomyces frigidus]|nr:hypothetical protein LTR85_006737 [Meristemomyces frigidus]